MRLGGRRKKRESDKGYKANFVLYLLVCAVTELGDPSCTWGLIHGRFIYVGLSFVMINLSVKDWPTGVLIYRKVFFMSSYTATLVLPALQE